MAQEQVTLIEDEEEDLDILDSVIDIVSIGTGCITGAAIGYGLDKIIPAATNTIENVFRTVGIGSAVVSGQWLTSNAVASDARETRMIIRGLHGMVSNKMFENKEDNN